MSISSLLYKNTKDFGDTVAFYEGSKKYTYTQFTQMVEDAKKILLKNGIKKGSRVILLEPISVRLYVALMAIWDLGASVIIFDPTATPDYIKRCLTRVEPDFFIGCKKAFLLKIKLSALREIKKSILIDELFSIKSKEPIDFENSCDKSFEDLPALITFTSGSTGIPKVAVRTQGFLITQYKIIDKTMKYNEGDIDLAVLPVFTIANLAKGISTVIPHKSFSKIATSSPKKTIEQIKKFGITRITASPAIIAKLADYLKQTGQEGCSVKTLNVGGGPIFPHLVQNVKDAFPNAKLLLVYGSTEAEPIAEVEYSNLTKAHFDSVASGAGLIGGYVTCDIDCCVIKNEKAHIGKITNEEFEKMKLHHDVGEIVVSGNHVLKGYLGGIGDDENKFDVGETRWHRTGDLGYFDKNGMLWLMGRASAVISDEKGVVYPFAIESAVCEKFGIKRSAVTVSKGKRILVVQCSKQQLENLEKIKAEFGIDTVLQIKNMPLDVRHHSKIDYNKLKDFVEKSKV
ncbi:MAG: AMP-binding protein [Acutalibacteraceae bacterium]